MDSAIIKSKFTYSTTVGIAPFKSNSIIIYIVEPGNSGTLQSAISIQNLEAGFQQIDDVGDVNGTFSPATINCDPMIMCQPSRINSARCVARFISNGYQGTGTLINNESYDGKAYFLTAFHVVDANNNKAIDASEIAALQNSRFQFQFWRTTCNGTIISTGIQFSGAIVRASSKYSDVILLELSNSPGIGDGVNYAGWSRTTSTPGNSLSSIIHHPQGEDMRITNTNNVRTWLYNSSYWTAHYSSGTTAPGSSGAALLNENTQIVGQLKGGWSSCNYTSFGDRYGKFSTSWGGANLQPWLSPNQGLQNTTSLVLSPFVIQGNAAVYCTGQTQYTVPNILGATYNWQVSTNLQISSGQGSPTIMVTNLGGNNSGFVTATINTPTKGYNRSLAVTKTLTTNTGGPIVNISYSMNGGCNGTYQTWSLAASSPNTVSSWLWTVDNPSSGSWYIYSPNSPTTFVDVSGGGGISVTATNSCGTTKNGVTIYSNCHGLVANPNPATDNVDISLAQSNNVASANKKKEMIYQIKVTDLPGNLKKQYQYSSGISNARISLIGLTKGVYIVQAFDGTSWSSVQLIKQ